MTTTTLTGTLVSPITDQPLSNAIIRFTSLSNFVTTEGSIASFNTDANAAYNFQITAGTYAVDILSGPRWTSIGKATVPVPVNPVAIELVALLASVEPLTAPEIAQVQALLTDAQTAAQASAASAVTAAGFATSAVLLTGNQVVAGEKTYSDTLSVVSSALAGRLLALQTSGGRALYMDAPAGAGDTSPFIIGTGNAMILRVATTDAITIGSGGGVAIEAPTSASAQGTNISSLTRRDFVNALDDENVKLTGDQRIEGAKTAVNKLSVENGVDVTVKSTSATNSTGKIGDVAAQQGMWVSNNGQTTLSSSSGSLLLKTGGWGSVAYNVILRSTGEFDAGDNYISYSGTDRNVMVLGNDNAITRALGNDPGHAAGLSWAGNNFCRLTGSGGIGLTIGDGNNFSISSTDGTVRTTRATFPSDGVISDAIDLITKGFMESSTVLLSGAQTIGGDKTWTGDQTFNSGIWVPGGGNSALSIGGTAHTAPSHSITTNDGGGNFNIRIGHHYSGGTYATDSGVPWAIECNNDVTNHSSGYIAFRVVGAIVSQGDEIGNAGTAVTPWMTAGYFSPTGVNTGIAPTQGDNLCNKTYVDAIANAVADAIDALAGDSSTIRALLL